MNEPFGFVVIDKPLGITSHDCVNRVRKVFKIKRVGHGGTLDPAVTGVLPIALGAATRLLNYLPSDKTYKGIIQLGKSTTTDDLQGEIISSKSWPSLNQISLERHLEKFRGLIHQHPPQVSSIHINGERAYKRVLRGEKLELPSRALTIHELLLLKWDQELGQISVNVHCSSGTYIRALARDIGNSLGCGGCLASLRRSQALGFHETQATPLPKDSDATLSLVKSVIPPIKAFQHLPCFRMTTEMELIHWRTGRQIEVSNTKIEPALNAELSKEQKETNFIVAIDPLGAVVGIAKRHTDSLLQPKVVFNALG